jgi:hypothetical protein
MNSKIKELKKRSYKKRVEKLLCDFVECEIISSDDIPIEDMEFVKNFYMQYQVTRVEFSIYNSETQMYIDNIEEVKKKALDVFLQNLYIFNSSEKVCFNFSYEDEHYIIKSNIRDVILNFNILEHKGLPVVLYNEQKSAILTLYKLEYVIEFIKWTANNTIKTKQ